uniref:Leucine-rich repeat-containing G-protein coupled receptor 4-like protein n=1 Tax=Rhynchophorus ferrugineus TaxID=354439 RepID=A0A5Q0TX29_RHYFE|nr:leucine-rich repeat-containing G-protein coupled receptor 4-like protein [Rhynchophorus ferrugineus]
MKIFWVLSAIVALAYALPEIPVNCVRSCKCLEVVPNIVQVTTCDSPITVNSAFLNHLNKTSVTVISFANVIIENISENAFTQIPLLEDIVIENTNIGHIDSKAFDNVKKVKLANCAIEDFPNLKSEKLEELHFGNCKLLDIPPLENLFSLTFLNLSVNYIKNIDIMAFAELFDLDTLILSNNEITKIPSNVFINNRALNSLYLDNNPLKSFSLNTSNNLETLSLRNCYLTEFDYHSSSKLIMLNELNLRNNKIRILKSGDLSSMKQLTVIDLSANNLIQVDNDAFAGNPKLNKLILDDNKFDQLPNFTLANGENFEMYTFSCENCEIQTIHKDTFKYMPALDNLNLGHNKLKSLSDSFNYITSLRLLDVSYNNITNLSELSFEHNVNLENLNIAGNPLLTLNPDAFVYTRNIKKIDASNCRLYKLWSSNKTSLMSLKKLLIADNQLVTLSTTDFKLIPHLEAIDVHNNPLKFDEEFCKLIGYLEKQAVYPIDVSSPMTNPEDVLANDIENFVLYKWSTIRNNNCSELSNDINEKDDFDYIEWGDDNKTGKFPPWTKYNSIKIRTTIIMTVMITALTKMMKTKMKTKMRRSKTIELRLK